MKVKLKSLALWLMDHRSQVVISSLVLLAGAAGGVWLASGGVSQVKQWNRAVTGEINLGPAQSPNDTAQKSPPGQDLALTSPSPPVGKEEGGKTAPDLATSSSPPIPTSPPDYEGQLLHLSNQIVSLKALYSELVTKYQKQSTELSQLKIAVGQINSQPAASNSGLGLESSPSPPANSSVINLNTATADQLESLPGIGPTLAARIVEYRLKQGLFKTIDDLDLVSGISANLISKIRSQVRV